MNGPITRRRFSRLTAASLMLTGSRSHARPESQPPGGESGAGRSSQETESAGRNGLEYEGGLTDIPGIRVGHFTDTRRPTGCTVILTEVGAVAGVDVRGSAPGTRETELLDPLNTVERVHAVVLSGGSAFGLETAGGVMKYLEEKGIGYPTRAAKVPIVPAAILYDLGLGDPSIRPGPEAGYQACRNATSGRVEEGNVGAGTGATVGKLLGPARGMKGGLGSFAFRVEDLIVAAVAAVNAVGDVVDPESGRILAGARSEDGQSLADAARVLRSRRFRPPARKAENTTIGVVATNARLTKAQAAKMAQMAHDGLARAVTPVHLPADGDTLFALSLGQLDADLGQVGALAADALSRAIVRAVLQARSLPDWPAHRDLQP